MFVVVLCSLLQCLRIFFPRIFAHSHTYAVDKLWMIIMYEKFGEILICNLNKAWNMQTKQHKSYAYKVFILHIGWTHSMELIFSVPAFIGYKDCFFSLIEITIPYGWHVSYYSFGCHYFFVAHKKHFCLMYIFNGLVFNLLLNVNKNAKR